MREAKFGPAILLANFENNVSAVPFGLVLDEIEHCVRDMPPDPLAPHEFGDLLSATVNILVAVRELSAEFAGAALDVS